MFYKRLYSIQFYLDTTAYKDYTVVTGLIIALK